MPLITMILLCLASQILAAEVSLGKIRGLERAEKILEFPRKDLVSSAEGEVSAQRCHVFPTFVAVEIDTGRVGADEVWLRRREPGKAVEGICAARKRAGEMTLKREEQYVLGAAGDFLFTQSADGAGEEMGLWVYDAVSGNQLFQASYHMHRDFRVARRAGTVSLEYFSRLSLACDLSQKGPSCWRSTLRDNHIASGVKINRPDCRAVFQSADWKAHPGFAHEPRAIQLFAKVLVPDVRTAKLQFAGGDTLCSAAP